MTVMWSRMRPATGSFSRPVIAASAAGFAVAIGYMDPGNWATDLDAARYGNSLLWAIILSGIAAALLQLLVVRCTTVSGKDLIHAFTDCFPTVAAALWPLYVLAIVATEVAEFIGLTVGIKMVFATSLPLAAAYAVTVFSLLLMAGGALTKRFEVLAIITTLCVAIAYAVELTILHPSVQPLVAGAIVPHIQSAQALLSVVAIMGATIMPHNLFLHSGLLLDAGAKPRHSFRNVIIGTLGTLALATFINVAISVVGTTTHTSTIEAAFQTLRPIGGSAASLLFGVCLIAAALAAAASGACAGDIICSDRAPIALTRLQRRALAVIPAVVLLACGLSPTMLLVFSQVALGLILPAVVVPLIILALRDRALRSRADYALIAMSSIVLTISCGCEGLAFTTLVPHS